jgi:hypothetical protein
MADAIVGEMIIFTFEIYSRCQLCAAHEMKSIDGGAGNLGIHQIAPILKEWGPRLSVLQQELKALLQLQGQVRHVNGIADREAARLRSVRAQLDPLTPTIFPDADPSIQSDMQAGQQEPGDGQPS